MSWESADSWLPAPYQTSLSLPLLLCSPWCLQGCFSHSSLLQLLPTLFCPFSSRLSEKGHYICLLAQVSAVAGAFWRQLKPAMSNKQLLLSSYLNHLCSPPHHYQSLAMETQYPGSLKSPVRCEAFDRKTSSGWLNKT